MDEKVKRIKRSIDPEVWFGIRMLALRRHKTVMQLIEEILRAEVEYSGVLESEKEKGG